MNDYEKLKLLLIEFGIGFDEYDDEYKVISIETGKAKVGGYSGFSVEYSFSKDGKFIEMEIWE